MPEQRKVQQVVAVRPDREVATRQRLPYFIGVSADTVGAAGLSMHLVVIPPGARAAPHLHQGYETAIYVLEGRVETRYGDKLSESVISEAGEFLFIPPDVPHEAINLSETEPARAIVARNDANEQERVLPYSIEGVMPGG
ncbi:MAG TPA: cupin domain-containing protein [Noviherbaspirillum sp.]|nr:cupin domain-containing protein [Noviherbaspirillum sp.]